MAPALIVTVATVVIGVLSYPSMPEVLAVHYARGVPNRVASKSVRVPALLERGQSYRAGSVVRDWA